jgi:hypothetical protein
VSYSNAQIIINCFKFYDGVFIELIGYVFSQQDSNYTLLYADPLKTSEIFIYKIHIRSTNARIYLDEYLILPLFVNNHKNDMESFILPLLLLVFIF